MNVHAHTSMQIVLEILNHRCSLFIENSNGLVLLDLFSFDTESHFEFLSPRIIYNMLGCHSWFQRLRSIPRPLHRLLRRRRSRTGIQWPGPYLDSHFGFFRQGEGLVDGIRKRRLHSDFSRPRRLGRLDARLQLLLVCQKQRKIGVCMQRQWILV